MLCDNVLQDGDVLESRFAVTRRTRTIHSRMRASLYELTHNEHLETAILNIGAVSYTHLDVYKRQVDVHSPQEIINVEIRKVAYIYSITIPGPGGLPVGTNGRGMAGSMNLKKRLLELVVLAVGQKLLHVYLVIS